MIVFVMAFNRWNKFRSAGQKYNSGRSKLDGYSFASQMEAAGYLMLKAREQAGEIVVEKVQDRVFLTDADIEYRPDFKCRVVATDEIFWVEIKGFETTDWRIKLRLWRHYGPGRLDVYKGSAKNLRLYESVIPVPKTA